MQEFDEVFLDQLIINIENKNAPSVMEEKQILPSETVAETLCYEELNNQSMIIDKENVNDQNTIIKNISSPFILEGKQDSSSKTDKVASQGLSSRSSHRRHSLPEINDDKSTVSLVSHITD